MTACIIRERSNKVVTLKYEELHFIQTLSSSKKGQSKNVVLLHFLVAPI